MQSFNEMIAKDILELKSEKSQLVRQYNIYENRLKRTKHNINQEKLNIDPELARLAEFFPSINLEKIKEIDRFHNSLTGILKEELKKSELELTKQIKCILSDIEKVDRKIEEKLNIKNAPKYTYEKVIDLSAQIQQLNDENKHAKIRTFHSLCVMQINSGSLMSASQKSKRSGGGSCHPKKSDGPIVPKTVTKFKATTNSKHDYPVSPNLLNRNFKVDKPFVAWVSDITYIATREGCLYLAAIMDLYSGKIVGWAMSERMTQEIVISALKQAIGRTRPPRGIILHSDHGVQYACKRYRNLTKSYGFQQSMSRNQDRTSLPRGLQNTERSSSKYL